jgi:hypothetical protein
MSRSITLSQREIFLRKDFERLGTPSRVTRALQELLKEGKLVRIGYGIYSKTTPSAISGKPIPRKPLESLVMEALKALEIQSELGKAQKEYSSGATTQIPMSLVVNIGDARFTRKITLGGREVIYERNLVGAK